MSLRESPSFEVDCGRLLAELVRMMQRPLPPATALGCVYGSDGYAYNVRVERIGPR